MVPLPVRKVDGVFDGAVNRELGNVFKTGMIILKTHRSSWWLGEREPVNQ